MPLVFTPNFLRCLSNNLSKHDSYLHGTAKKCLDRITAFMGAWLLVFAWEFEALGDWDVKVSLHATGLWCAHGFASAMRSWIGHPVVSPQATA